MASTQSYKSHRRYFPLHHYFVVPVLMANFFIEASRLFRNPTMEQGWLVVVAAALALLPFSARIMALTAQGRSIRLEEQLRLARLMPNEDSTIAALTPGQLVGLRFASDEEAPDLARRCAAGELKGAEAVKRQIKNWRPDNLRV
jgi:hypothetical protein